MIMRWFAALAGAFLVLGAGAAQAAAAAPEDQAFVAAMRALAADLHPQTGAVPVTAAHVTLNLGEGYYFLPASEARRVLVEAWGNPPDSVGDVIGMIFPADRSFLDDTWGAVLTYSPDGYVPDANADSIDYSKLLEDLRRGEDADNRARRQAGFAEVHLIGWAQQPSYDRQHHSLVWAKEIAFSDMQGLHTLNYDVRVLGRHGVFSMNMVTTMDHLEDTRTAANQLMTTVAFDPGAQYADYREGADRKAAYGVAGLVAGGAAVALAKKAGLLSILFLILKKGGVFILAALGGAATWLRNLFAGKKGGQFSTRPSAPRGAQGLEADPGLAPPVGDDQPRDPDREL